MAITRLPNHPIIQFILVALCAFCFGPLATNHERVQRGPNVEPARKHFGNLGGDRQLDPVPGAERERSARRPIDFTLDRAQPGKLLDLPKELAKAA